jgi:hypothetical protein
MIFQRKHIELILKGEKTQTRRKSGHYFVGKTYAIQEGRGQKARMEGRIRITSYLAEIRDNDGDISILKTSPCGYNSRQLISVSENPVKAISIEDARAEGGYTPEAYEELYEQLYPGWEIRFAFTFVFEPSPEYLESQDAEFDSQQGVADAEAEAKAEYERDAEIEYEREMRDEGHPEES